MKYMTIGEIINKYSKHFTELELRELRSMNRKTFRLAEQIKLLHSILFAEETDFMMDSCSDAKDRARGINPMSQEYTNRINKKREALGVVPFLENSSSHGKPSKLFCEDVVRVTKKYREYLDAKKTKGKQRVFVDMDNVLVNFQSGIDQLSEEEIKQYGPDNLDNVPGIFSLMKPNEGSVEAYKWLNEKFDTYILSTAPWDNPSAWTDKLLWVKKYLPEAAYKRLILSHHKNLLEGDYIIDDRDARGVDKFKGRHLHFAEKGKGFEGWKEVLTYMKKVA